MVRLTQLARIATLFVAVAALAGCASTSGSVGAPGSTLDKIKRTNTVTLGYRTTSVPFSFAAPGKEPAGYSIDLCRAVVESLKKELGLPNLQTKWEAVTVENRLGKVADGSVDLECGSTTNTLARRQQVDFSLLTFADGGSFLTKLGSNIATVKDLNGKRVAIIPGTSTEKSLNAALQQSLAKPSFVTVRDHQEGLVALREGRADAYASDRTILIGLAVTAKDAATFRLSDDLFSYEPYSLVLRRGDPEFRLMVDRTLARLYRSAEIGAIYNRWFGAMGTPSPLLQAMFLLNGIPE
ncbi:MAG: amino acid ABC transporter substrate-binding protein [Burkholderiales bacterium]|jgi:ABC-type amino acid transport substrate-binding protein|nr:amino acid ABC transporter substrate-binding protein [Burkholderiales bacterium]